MTLRYAITKGTRASVGLKAESSIIEIERAHFPEYLHRVCTGRIAEAEISRIGLPWSPEWVERSRRSSGATIAARRTAKT